MARIFNVTYYTGWGQPEIFRNVSQQKANELYYEGKMMKYRVIVSEIDPETNELIYNHTGSELQ
jgi:hypothetical protein